ncbi:hypothetical protein KKC22_07840 [Myxococcota bacterium]|nr:hypothetical protein [Myxococcota bacterium]
MTDKTPGPASTPAPAQDTPDDWKPRRTYLVGVKAYFPKVRLLEENPSRWLFLPEGNSNVMGWLQILSGFVLGGIILREILATWFSYYVIFQLFGLLYVAAFFIGHGVVRMKANRTVVSFDLGSKTCRLRYRRGHEENNELEEGELLARLDEVRAVQYLNVLDSLCWDRRCYELNLVMKDDSRVFVVGARLPEPLREDAVRLAGLLGRPLLEASTQSPSGEYTWPLGYSRPVRRRRSHEAPKVL